MGVKGRLNAEASKDVSIRVIELNRKVIKASRE